MSFEKSVMTVAGTSVTAKGFCALWPVLECESWNSRMRRRGRNEHEDERWFWPERRRRGRFVYAYRDMTPLLPALERISLSSLPHEVRLMALRPPFPRAH